MYIKCSSLPAQSISTPNLRLFWRQKQPALPQALLGVTLRREINVFSADEPAPELPAELEHIRWCRYHFLNNRRRGRPENGKSKDLTRRIHTLLYPYSELPKAEKEKDRKNIRVLLSIK